MPSSHDSSDRPGRRAPRDRDPWDEPWTPSSSSPSRESVEPYERPAPREERVPPARTPPGAELPAATSRRTPRDARRSRILALIVLMLIAVIVGLVGVAAGNSALDGSKDGGAFRLLPITTTTT